jgi:hypothetical protein
VFDGLPVLVVVPHAEAGDRTAWRLDQDLRPLTEEGRAQASSLAETVGPVDRIVSSPARRCVETVEPLADISDVDIEFSDDLRELTYVTDLEAWEAWGAIEGVWRGQLLAGGGLGRFLRVVDDTRGTGNRVALSAHGDLVPLFALLFAAHFHIPAPTPVARGGCFEIDASNVAQPITSLGALLPRPA